VFVRLYRTFLYRAGPCYSCKVGLLVLLLYMFHLVLMCMDMDVCPGCWGLPSHVFLLHDVNHLTVIISPIYTEILVDPSNQTVPVNSTANFFCRAWGRNAKWYINNTVVDAFSQETYESKGFTFTEKITRSRGQDHEFNLNITVTASAAINTTNFSCTVTLDQFAVSMPAYLIVMGKSCLSWLTSN